MTAYVAFTDWNGVSLSMNWIGTINFEKIFADRVFWKALGNNVRWTLLFLTVPVGIGFSPRCCCSSAAARAPSTR